MELTHITFQGPNIDDFELLERLPKNLGSLLGSLNGFIQFGGGLHVRGACRGPHWHSLREVWIGPSAFHNLYATVDPSWIPFAEDCVGDQFFIENKDILRLSAETGDVNRLGLNLAAFLEHANTNPVEFLSLEPLLQFQQEKGSVQPGYLIHAYPPFCSVEAADGVSLKAVPSSKLYELHATLASQLTEDGGQIRVVVTD